ncbi:patatin-like protein 7 [Prunus avium]|uniref:Patatin n=1 Tax=Prunus avium TaxID=42229 RepID=A0A6P5RH00_PRUAV|nr:patatin-like protein 7 [Prunus avium]
MAALSTSSPMLNIDTNSPDVDKLSYEIFSILENNFLFGYNNNGSTGANENPTAQNLLSDPKPTNLSTPLHHMHSSKHFTGKVRVLAIDAAGATDGLLAANSLAHLESSLRCKSGNPNAAISDFFDVVSGSGSGGVLAALLFTRGSKDGSTRPMFTAQEALNFLLDNRRRIFRSSRKTFGDHLSLKDTLKSVLIPCYDMSSRAPFLFSRADAVEMDGYDFKMKDVCAATSAQPAVEVRSVDGRTKIMALDGGIAMNNPTAAAITHVLNNKQEFPFCNGVEDLLVVSLGNGESELGNLSPSGCLKIAGEGASDLVDQAVSMAFGQSRASNYVRVQANGIISKMHGGLQASSKNKSKKIDMLALTEEMLAQKNVEAVLFKGKKMVESTNVEKLEMFAGELIKEEERRKTCFLPTVVLKQTCSTSPSRTSSATTLSTMSSSC